MSLFANTTRTVEPPPAVRFERNEHELLIACARVRLSGERAERVRDLVSDGLDWPYLLHLSLRHRVAPLLFRHLNTCCGGAIPPDVLDRLKREAGVVTFHSMNGALELVRIVKLFEQHGIRALAFKGPVLGATVYGDIGLRPFGDLDLLVPRHEIPRCKMLLEEKGYRPELQMSAPEEEKYVNEAQFALRMVNQQGGLLSQVDLHWTLTHRFFAFRLDPEEVSRCAIPVNVAGSRILSLAPDDLILFLCVHGAKHHWEQLIWICDVAEYLRLSPGVDWERLFARAEALGGLRMLNLGLCLAHSLLDAPLPDAAMPAVMDPVAGTLAATSTAWLFRSESDAPSAVERLKYHTRMRERFYHRLPSYVNYMRLSLTPGEEDKEFVRLPAQLSFLHYLIRPIRILVKGRAR